MSTNIFIAYSSNFRNKKTFSEKVEKILSAIEDFSITTTIDHNSLIKEKFKNKQITETGKNQTIREIKKTLSKSNYFIAFWDGTEIDQYIYIANLLKIKSRIITIETTRAVNKDRGEEYDVYIGRGTPWGNPFAIGDEGMTREEVIEKYKIYFKETFLENPAKLKELKSLKNKRLGCHCKPAACHGDVISNFLNSIDD